MRSRGGGFRRGLLEMPCYSSVPSMLLPSKIPKQEHSQELSESLMRAGQGRPVALLHRPGGHGGGGSARRSRRGRCRGAVRPSEAQRRTSQAAVRGEGGEPEGERRRSLGRADRRGGREGRQGPPGRG